MNSVPEVVAEKENQFCISLGRVSFLADIFGMFAKVTCQQEFENHNMVSVEAVYVFPLPEDASVVGCEMAIGDKKITAELKEKEQSKKEYEEAVEAGHHASLLEQKRDNIFRINVGGIEPGEKIKIITTYSQRVHWQDNGGRFNIPLVVAPRFIPGNPTGEKTGGSWAENTDEVPDASEITPVVIKEGVPHTADIKVILSPGFSCSINSPSHDLIVGEHSFTDSPVEIGLKDLTPDRDFILCYQSESSKVDAAIHKVAFEGKNYVTIDVIPSGVTVTMPKDVIFCLDVSLSMSGAKIEGLKLVAENVARRLSRQDVRNRVAVVAFESCVHPLHPLSKITDTTFAAINRLSSRGNTYAGKALDYCFHEFSEDAGSEKYILLVSDGQTEDRWSKIVPDIRVVAVGLDTAVNMSYLKDIARETGGVSISVYPGEDYDSVASNLSGLLSGPVLRDIEVLSGDKKLSDVFGGNDVYASMPASLSLKLDSLPDEVQIQGFDNEDKQEAIALSLADAAECAFAHQIWAREKLRDSNLSDAGLIDISLKYGVICSKTAFVAVHLKEVPGQKPEKVEIPVNLPHTWDYDMIFGGLLRNMVSSSSQSSSSMNVIHLSTELAIFTNSFERGGITKLEAETRWKSLISEISVSQIAGWTIRQQAKAYYYLLKLKTFGFEVDEVVLKLLSVEPDQIDTEAYSWWIKAQQILGIKNNNE